MRMTRCLSSGGKKVEYGYNKNRINLIPKVYLLITLQVDRYLRGLDVRCLFKTENNFLTRSALYKVKAIFLNI